MDGRLFEVESSHLIGGIRVYTLKGLPLERRCAVYHYGCLDNSDKTILMLISVAGRNI